MIRCELEIRNKLGLHARAAAKFVRCAGQFDCHISVNRGEMSVNGKSIMGVLLLAAPKGSVLEIVAEGPDEGAAAAALAELVAAKFDEE